MDRVDLRLGSVLDSGVSSAFLPADLRDDLRSGAAGVSAFFPATDLSEADVVVGLETASFALGSAIFAGIWTGAVGASGSRTGAAELCTGADVTGGGEAIVGLGMVRAGLNDP